MARVDVSQIVAREREEPTPVRYPSTIERIARAGRYSLMGRPRLWPLDLALVLAPKTDIEMIEGIYRNVLNRYPDTIGLATYSKALASGALTPLEMLGKVRFSPEGDAVGWPIRGLRWR